MLIWRIPIVGLLNADASSGYSRQHEGKAIHGDTWEFLRAFRLMAVVGARFLTT